MLLVERFWTAITHVVSTLLFLPIGHDGNGIQQPLHQSRPHETPLTVDYPSFKPPGIITLPGEQAFTCEYPDYVNWTACSTKDRRGCWLQHNSNGSIFNINTDYEKDAPRGITRRYNLTVGWGEHNADGINFPNAMLYNNMYPGPWIQACWGDTVEVNVTVDKDFPNGTAVHWHGIRQNQTMHMDGVPGVTQCPIAPGSWFVYRWKAIQYGSAWYHSHYSLQYADGLLGPLTIYGPATSPFDEAAALPLLLTDWGHVSAFKTIYNRDDPENLPTILMNGIGNIEKARKDVKAREKIPTPTTLVFEEGKRYLLRIINTAFDSTFLFTIDNHFLEVISADFVPIAPYTTNAIVVGIGQRYNIVVRANPVAGRTNSLPKEGNFWIRTYVMDKCFGESPGGDNYSEVGILRYNRTSIDEPNSIRWNDVNPRSQVCEGEAGWKPWFPWDIGTKMNGNDEQDVAFVGKGEYPLAKFAIAPPKAALFTPLQVNYSDITFFNLDNDGYWPEPWVVVSEDGAPDSWVYLALTGANAQGTGAHPIHLHGHDFAILAQESNKAYNASNVTLNLYNPQRRDVVLLPDNGYVVIAFKSDNPGAWLLHCHIARHASEGLAMQLLEDRKKAATIWPPTSPEKIKAEDLCTEWKEWTHGRDFKLDDSGI